MEGRQSKCNHCIHALLGCSHSPSCAFKSECENSTLVLLQRLKGNHCSRAVPVVSLFQAWHGNLRSDSVLVHPGYMGTGAILVPGFGTQPYN